VVRTHQELRKEITDPITAAAVFAATSGGAGMIAGYGVGYFVKKAMKVVTATVGGLTVFGMILEYYGIITINWEKISSRISEGMGSLANIAMIIVDTTSHHMAAPGVPTHIQVAGLEVPLGAALGFVPGVWMGWRRG
jgi:uncharacterized membrane protein (Fun14 family)